MIDEFHGGVINPKPEKDKTKDAAAPQDTTPNPQNSVEDDVWATPGQPQPVAQPSTKPHEPASQPEAAPPPVAEEPAQAQTSSPPPQQPSAEATPTTPPRQEVTQEQIQQIFDSAYEAMVPLVQQGHDVENILSIGSFAQLPDDMKNALRERLQPITQRQQQAQAQPTPPAVEPTQEPAQPPDPAPAPEQPAPSASAEEDANVEQRDQQSEEEKTEAAFEQAMQLLASGQSVEQIMDGINLPEHLKQQIRQKLQQAAAEKQRREHEMAQQTRQKQEESKSFGKLFSLSAMASFISKRTMEKIQAIFAQQPHLEQQIKMQGQALLKAGAEPDMEFARSSVQIGGQSPNVPMQEKDKVQQR